MSIGLCQNHLIQCRATFTGEESQISRECCHSPPVEPAQDGTEQCKSCSSGSSSSSCLLTPSRRLQHKTKPLQYWFSDASPSISYRPTTIFEHDQARAYRPQASLQPLDERGTCVRPHLPEAENLDRRRSPSVAFLEALTPKKKPLGGRRWYSTESIGKQQQLGDEPQKATESPRRRLRKRNRMSTD